MSKDGYTNFADRESMTLTACRAVHRIEPKLHHRAFINSWLLWKYRIEVTIQSRNQTFKKLSKPVRLRLR